MDKKQFAKDFERGMKENKLKAYQEASLKFPLTDTQLKEFKELAKEIKGVVV